MRRRYSEHTANKPGVYDPMKETAIPLPSSRNRYNPVVQDRPLTPDGLEEPTTVRSYIRLNKNTKSHPLRDKADQQLMNQKIPKKSSIFNAPLLPVFKPDEKKRDALYKTAQTRTKSAVINGRRNSETTENVTAGKIDARRKTTPVVSERPKRASRTPPSIQRKPTGETNISKIRAKTPIRAVTQRAMQIAAMAQDHEIRKEDPYRNITPIRPKALSPPRVVFSTSSSTCPIWTDEDESLITKEIFTNGVMDNAVRRHKNRIIETVKRRVYFKLKTRITCPALRLAMERYQEKKTKGELSLPEEAVITIDSD